ncbi:MAG: c-type cytochrome [Gemmatimonadetes bacterium]|nr:c-type cytochrome [Gemmatimonadota bacterium]
MPDSRIPVRACLVLVATCLAFVPLCAGEAQLPTRFTNLRVLPPDIAPDSLLSVMGGFTRALGVRCIHCHVAANGVRPSAEEFALDGSEAKRVARVMWQMVEAINGQHLPAIGRPVAALARVTCATCHRGIARPIPLEEVLRVTYERAGIDSTIAQYRGLRREHFGASAYDFSELPLPTLADRLAEHAARRPDAARLMRLNLEFYPASWFTYQQLAQLEAAMGDTTAAILSLERGLALNPQRAFLRELLARLKPR